MRSLTMKAERVLVIGSFGVESRDKKWKATGLGDQTGREFTLWMVSPGKWAARGSSFKGSRKYHSFPALGLNDAIMQAIAALYGVSRGPEQPNLTVAEALHDTIGTNGGSDRHRKNLYQFSGYFCEWCDRAGLAYWHQLQYADVRKYMMQLFDRGLKAKTVSHYLEPIRSTARYMAANYPNHYQDICSTLRLPPHAGRDGVYRGDDGNPVLSFEEVLDFLDWLEPYEWGHILIPGVMLQGLCGLQLREALRLRWSDVDAEAGTVTIQDHPDVGDRVKNQYRVRRIPLPTMVQDYLNDHIRNRGRVVPYDKGDKAYGKLLKRALRKWDPDCDLAPKDLRNTIQTHAIEEGWSAYVVERYVGHAPKSVAERHYFGDKKRRMVDLYREHVSNKVNGEIDKMREAKWQKMAIDSNVVQLSTLPRCS